MTATRSIVKPSLLQHQVDSLLETVRSFADEGLTDESRFFRGSVLTG